MQPASTLKVLTSVVALDTLGPTYRGRVTLQGQREGNRLTGDTLLKGHGNVEMDTEALIRLLRPIREQGIDVIGGRVLLDRTLYQPSRPDVGVPPFDNQSEWQYNVIPDALMLGMNLVGLRLNSNANTVTPQIDPPMRTVRLISELKVIDAPCADWEKGWKTPISEPVKDGLQVIRLQGTFPRNCMQKPQLNILDRTVYARGVLEHAWSQLNGRFAAQVLELDDQGKAILPASTVLANPYEGTSTAAVTATLVTSATPSATVTVSTPRAVSSTVSSRPLNQYIHAINKRSDNPVTRMTFSALAGSGEGSTFTRADAKVRQWLASQGIDATGLVLENGSGLSRMEKITPKMLANVLVASNAGKWGPELQASLPIVGLDNMLRKSITEGPVMQRARIKTGSLRNVRAIAGYVLDGNNEPLVVVTIINLAPNEEIGARNDAIRNVLDAVLNWAAASK